MSTAELSTRAISRELEWSPPGPGTWTIAADHFPRPLTPSVEPITGVWSEAISEVMNSFGIPIGEVRMSLVNGIPYLKFGDDAGSAKPPPAWVMWFALKLVPSLRKAERDTARVLRERPWVAGVRQWYEVDRAKAIARVEAVARINPTALSDTELAAHLLEQHSEMFASVREHLLLHAYDEAPVALFAMRMIEWGFETSEALRLLSGASPASTGMSEELGALQQAVDGRRANSIDELRGLGPEVAGALDRYLERHGWRILDGYDIDGKCLIEVPSLVLALATSAPPADARPELDAAIGDARARVPSRDQAEFDRLLEEGRAGYGLRDDNSAILYVWPAGLYRRALLEAGRRLAERGELPSAELVVEASPEDVSKSLEGGGRLDAEKLKASAEMRHSTLARDAPRRLGPPAAPIPTHFPGAFGTMLRAFATSGTTTVEHETPLRGLGFGNEAYEGTARLVTGAGVGFDGFEPGDVLVAAMTSPSYNVVLAVAGALVTEEGDGFSHAAIMSRELGIPAVIGAREATKRIQDGDRVMVDPTTGTVRVLEGTADSTNQGDDS